MKNILILGAGRSSSSLIKYLLQQAEKENWQVVVGDISENAAKSKIQNHPKGKAIAFNIDNAEQRKENIASADIVISMLPAQMHYEIAKDCVRFKRNMITASYASAEIQKLDSEAKKNGVLLLNEVGLDPGIDHMSAMKIIDEIKSNSGKIISFKSYCGGLIAPESNDNPWGYKFTWSPRNVILAGQGTAKYIKNGQICYIPYDKLFTEIEKVTIPGCGEYDAYANRDSLSYIKHYGLEDVSTMLRATLRHKGFCNSWNAFVKLGLTDDSYKIKNSIDLTYRQLLEKFLPKTNNISIKEKLSQFLNVNSGSDIINNLEWTGIFEDKKIMLDNASPARILQCLLEEKWKLKDTDKDMILMQHQFIYEINKKTHKLVSSLVVKGDDNVYTAMAKTVGLPVGIAAKLILLKHFNLKGVQIPIAKEVYFPVLTELEKFQILFFEERKIF